MKKFTVLTLSLTLMLTLIGCETETKTYSGAPKIVLRGLDYYSTNLIILNKLPDGYLYAGKLTDDEKKYSNITKGYDYYIKAGSETIDDFYVYQEVDNSSGEWAYVKWSNIKNSVDELKERYPEYFELSSSDSVDIYVWKMAENSYQCGILSSGSDKTINDLWGMQGKSLSIEEAKLILDEAGIKDNNITIIPIYQPYSSHYYEINDEYLEEITKLFKEVD